MLWLKHMRRSRAIPSTTVCRCHPFRFLGPSLLKNRRGLRPLPMSATICLVAWTRMDIGRKPEITMAVWSRDILKWARRPQQDLVSTQGSSRHG
jgi:hypothetical protein